MSFLVIGDTHLKPANVPEIKELFIEIIKVAKERINDYSTIVFLGDIFDKHEIINTEVLTLATDFFYELSNIKPIYILIGNHDRPNNSDFLTNRHGLNAFKYWKNTYIIDTTTKINIENQNFIFVPYVPPGRFNEALNVLNKESQNEPEPISCIFAHQEFRNCNLGGGIKSIGGDEWNENIHIVSGHIHEYNRLNEYILYIGTPIQQTYGESSEKTISLIRFQNQNELKEERIKLNIQRKIEYNLTCNELLNFQIPENSKCRIIISGTQSEIKSISEITKNLKKNPNIVLKFNIITENNFITNIQEFKNMKYLDRLNNNINSSVNSNCLLWCLQNL